MQCSDCGSQNPQDAAFCGNCGTNLRAGAAADAQQAQQPTQPIPPPQPTQQMPAQAQQPAQQPPYGAPPTYGAQPQPSGGSNTALIIAILALAGVLLAGIALGAFFLFTRDDPATEPAPQASTDTTTDQQTGTDDGTSGSSASASSGQSDVGYPTAVDAVEAEVPSDWVIDLVVDDGAYVEFWVGPANSEYTEAYVVEQMADGSWIVTDVQPIGATDYGGTGTVGGQDEAVATVATFLDAIMDDRPLDAQALTIEPFSSDPASAQYSNGDFYGYTFDGVDSYEDGTFRVYVIETWSWGDDYYAYYVVPTELGYYISEVEPY